MLTITCLPDSSVLAPCPCSTSMRAIIPLRDWLDARAAREAA